jgi:hypothetical protein
MLGNPDPRGWDSWRVNMTTSSETWIFLLLYCLAFFFHLQCKVSKPTHPMAVLHSLILPLHLQV